MCAQDANKVRVEDRGQHQRMAHAARTYMGPGPAVQQPWMPPAPVPGYPPMPYGAPWPQPPQPVVSSLKK